MGNERRELPEATENRLRVQGGAKWPLRLNLRFGNSPGQMRSALQQGPPPPRRKVHPCFFVRLHLRNVDERHPPAVNAKILGPSQKD